MYYMVILVEDIIFKYLEYILLCVYSGVLVLYYHRALKGILQQNSLICKEVEKDEVHEYYELRIKSDNSERHVMEIYM